MSMETDPGTVKTTGTAFEIIEMLAREDGGHITELSTELGLAKSTIHRHLSTLEELGYVVKEDNKYQLGFRFLKLGEYTRSRDEIYKLAKEQVQKIAERTDERAQFIVEEHGEAVYVFRETGEHAVQTDSEIGKRIPLHATAAGKAILSRLSREEVDEIIEQHGLSAMTANTNSDSDELHDELQTIRDRGFSINHQENIEGLRAIGVPIEYPDGRVFGALSVSGPIHRFRGEFVEDTIPSLLLGTANELELNIKYS